MAPEIYRMKIQNLGKFEKMQMFGIKICGKRVFAQFGTHLFVFI